jgi:crossover junction endodeoxyribonuclease RuvC
MSRSGRKPSKVTGPVYIGVDPGLGITGYGILEQINGQIIVKEAGCIRTNRKAPMENRIAEIYEGLNEIIAEFKPEQVVIEDLYSHYRHPKTAIIMGHARGAIYLSAAVAGLPVKSYGATMIKKSLTGNGRASKLQIQRMVKAKLGLPTMPEPPDVADALAVALCHISHLNNSKTENK